MDESKVLLKKKSLLNRDLSLTLITRKLGKINVLAKGVKKIISKRLSYLETGNLLKVELYSKDNKFYLKEVSLISAFSKLKADLGKVKLLYAFFYVLNRFLPFNTQEYFVYRLTKRLMVKISLEDVSRQEFYRTISALLFHLGFLPNDKSTEEEVNKVIYEHINIKVDSLMI